MPASLIAMVVVSLLTPAPSKEVQDMVDEVRLPGGKTILASGH
jgi:cation/acetate symporter